MTSPKTVLQDLAVLTRSRKNDHVHAAFASSCKKLLDRSYSVATQELTSVLNAYDAGQVCFGRALEKDFRTYLPLVAKLGADVLKRWVKVSYELHLKRCEDASETSSRSPESHIDDFPETIDCQKWHRLVRMLIILPLDALDVLDHFGGKAAETHRAALHGSYLSMLLQVFLLSSESHRMVPARTVTSCCEALQDLVDRYGSKDLCKSIRRDLRMEVLGKVVAATTDLRLLQDLVWICHLLRPETRDLQANRHFYEQLFGFWAHPEYLSSLRNSHDGIAASAAAKARQGSVSAMMLISRGSQDELVEAMLRLSKELRVIGSDHPAFLALKSVQQVDAEGAGLWIQRSGLVIELASQNKTSLLFCDWDQVAQIELTRIEGCAAASLKLAPNARLRPWLETQTIRKLSSTISFILSDAHAALLDVLGRHGQRRKVGPSPALDLPSEVLAKLTTQPPALRQRKGAIAASIDVSERGEGSVVPPIEAECAEQEDLRRTQQEEPQPSLSEPASMSMPPPTQIQKRAQEMRHLSRHNAEQLRKENQSHAGKSVAQSSASPARAESETLSQLAAADPVQEMESFWSQPQDQHSVASQQQKIAPVTSKQPSSDAPHPPAQRKQPRRHAKDQSRKALQPSTQHRNGEQSGEDGESLQAQAEDHQRLGEGHSAKRTYAARQPTLQNVQRPRLVSKKIFAKPHRRLRSSDDDSLSSSNHDDEFDLDYQDLPGERKDEPARKRASKKAKLSTKVRRESPEHNAAASSPQRRQGSHPKEGVRASRITSRSSMTPKARRAPAQHSGPGEQQAHSAPLPHGETAAKPQSNPRHPSELLTDPAISSHENVARASPPAKLKSGEATIQRDPDDTANAKARDALPARREVLLQSEADRQPAIMVTRSTQDAAQQNPSAGHSEERLPQRVFIQLLSREDTPSDESAMAGQSASDVSIKGHTRTSSTAVPASPLAVGNRIGNSEQNGSGPQLGPPQRRDQTSPSSFAKRPTLPTIEDEHTPNLIRQPPTRSRFSATTGRMQETNGDRRPHRTPEPSELQSVLAAAEAFREKASALLASRGPDLQARTTTSQVLRRLHEQMNALVLLMVEQLAASLEDKATAVQEQCQILLTQATSEARTEVDWIADLLETVDELCDLTATLADPSKMPLPDAQSVEQAVETFQSLTASRRKELPETLF